MPYHLQRHRKPDDTLTEEEREVGLALHEYQVDPDQPTMFVSTQDLYLIYRRYIANQRHREYGVETLNKRQFGAALRRVFPLDDEAPDPYRVRRTVDGTRQWGILGLVGPLSQPSRDYVGRPSPDDPTPDT